MRKIVFIIFAIILLNSAKAQPPTPTGFPDNIFKGWYQFPGYVQIGNASFYLGDTTGSHPTGPTVRYWQHVGVDSALWLWNMTKWVKVGTGVNDGGGGGTDTLFSGPFTTSNIQAGFNPGNNQNIASVIAKVFYGILPPLASLGGGTTLELTSSGTVSATLSWGATRQSNTPPLATITVASQNQAFSQPSQPGTVSGTQGVNIPANATITYNNVVVDNTNVSTTASTTFTFLGRKYYGWITDTTGIGTGTQDAVIRAFTNQPFASTKSLSVNTGIPTGTQFYVYIYPSSLGALTGFSFNSFPSIDAMNVATRTFTNALGYSQSYKIYWNKNGQTASSDILAQ